MLHCSEGEGDFFFNEDEVMAGLDDTTRAELMAARIEVGRGLPCDNMPQPSLLGFCMFAAADCYQWRMVFLERIQGPPLFMHSVTVITRKESPETVQCAAAK
jgi:hypothetical protein